MYIYIFYYFASVNTESIYPSSFISPTYSQTQLGTAFNSSTISRWNSIILRVVSRGNTRETHPRPYLPLQHSCSMVARCQLSPKQTLGKFAMAVWLRYRRASIRLRIIINIRYRSSSNIPRVASVVLRTNGIFSTAQEKFHQPSTRRYRHDRRPT